MEDFKVSAIFRQSWYEAARDFLNDKERLQFYEMCFNYQFFGTEPQRETINSNAIAAMFAMVKPVLFADREKAIKVVQRNRQNGSRGGRPPKDYTNQQEVTTSNANLETQENPVGFFGKAYTNTIYNIQQTKNNSVCVQKESENFGEIEKDTHTKFLICLVFFENGSPDCLKEGAKFWNYYAARNWELPNSGPIRNVEAVAKAWRIEGANSDIATQRRQFASLVRFMYTQTQEHFFPLLSDYVTTQTNPEKKVVNFVHYGKRVSEWLTEESKFAILQKWVNTNIPAEWSIDLQQQPELKL